MKFNSISNDDLKTRAQEIKLDSVKQPDTPESLYYPDAFLKMVVRGEKETKNAYAHRLFRVWSKGNYRGQFLRALESYKKR